MKYNLSSQQYVLPSEDEGSKSLYRHLLVNDKTRTLFSFVPKTGCTNLRILFFLVQGTVTWQISYRVILLRYSLWWSWVCEN